MVLHGQISGIEIPATDVERAAKFYSDTFGWKFQAPANGTIPASKMQTFTAPGDIFPDEGVVSKVEEIPKSGAKFYINVDDLKATIEAVTKNGGKQLSDVISLGPHVPPFQFFHDTEGNTHAICTRPGK
uniref:Glyoxylase-like domain-containing protein n=1 Tax=Didymella fabae TaxID=372025 RepID=ASC10_DIDFA|nr:RecName: Full=Glyoxylase-like domain-containing protein; AltName: Full=Ascochitine biosynthesis cluster protein 10 [Ascochyta fabae]QEN17978.1 glyoxylase-like domain-containing protein [Ascochyta fabae]